MVSLFVALSNGFDRYIASRPVSFFFGTPRRQLITVAIVFGLLPLMANCYLAWRAYFIDSTEAQIFLDTRYCFKVAVGAGAATLANVLAFALLRLGPKKTLFFIFAQSIAVILAFAGIYQGHGLDKMPAVDLANDENYTSLYFSIVTWTTLGYGDLVAKADIRMVAAVEALLGYFSFGMLVGLLTAVASDARIGVAGALPASASAVPVRPVPAAAPAK
jgi:hypothetical protein